MQAIIDGRSYDTATATLVCDLSSPGLGWSDFRYEETSLYKSPNGTYFLAGHGGPRTRWAQSVGNGTSSGKGLALLDPLSARALCERDGTSEDYLEAFGTPEIG